MNEKKHSATVPTVHSEAPPKDDFDNPEFREFLKNRCPQLAADAGHTAMSGGGFDWVAIIELIYKAWLERRNRPAP